MFYVVSAWTVCPVRYKKVNHCSWQSSKKCFFWSHTNFTFLITLLFFSTIHVNYCFQIAQMKQKKTDSERCDRNMFRCENGPCIPRYRRCNGVVDCPFDTSDELDCVDCKCWTARNVDACFFGWNSDFNPLDAIQFF